MNWFDVDKEGLGQLLAGKDKAFVVHELLQNALDENSRRVSISITRIPNSPFVSLSVEDDNPEGFKDLSHAFTLFAKSEKKGDPNKRGRFNLGEKLVLAVCDEASISSTTGTVIFGKDGRKQSRKKRVSGSLFSGKIRMTNAELEQVIASSKFVFIPEGVDVFINEAVVRPRVPVATFYESLPTEIADNEGNLKKSLRKAEIKVYEVEEGEKAQLFEMGIPVVETGDAYHVSIGQKIPLNMNRDNVTPAYLRTVRTFLLNNMHEHLKEGEGSNAWVREALSDERVSDEALKNAVKNRFGDKVVSFDPSDPEANKLAVSKGYVVVHGGNLSGQEWANVRRAGAILPAGQVSPSPKPYSDDPNAEPVEVIKASEWTDGMWRHADLAVELARELMGVKLTVRFVKPKSRNFSAAYGGCRLDYAYNVLGADWFERAASREDNLRLLIHEFGHQYSGDHLSSEYHDALCCLGARLAMYMSKRA